MIFTNPQMFKSVIKPYNEIQQQPASYDLKLDNRIIRQDGSESTLDDDPYIYPHEFIIASTVEFVRIPRSVLGEVVGKSTNARLGLSVEEAGLIDPGFYGTITLELFNQSSKKINLKEIPLIAQIKLETTQPHGKLYSGHYQGQVGATKAWIEDE